MEAGNQWEREFDENFESMSWLYDICFADGTYEGDQR